MASSLANMIGGGDTGPITLMAWGSLSAGARAVYTIDNMKTGGVTAGKDALALIARFVHHASATAGIRIHTWPIQGYLNGTYAAATDHLKLITRKYQQMNFDDDKGDSTVSSPTSTDTQITLASGTEAAKFATGDAIIVDPATSRANVFSVLSVSGSVLQVERQIGSDVIAADRAVNYQSDLLKLDGVPVLGHLVVVENLDATYAHQLELLYTATAGSALG